MKVYLGINTKVLFDTIILELEDRGIESIILKEGDEIPNNSTVVLEASFINSIKLPNVGDYSNIIVIGYKEDLDSVNIDNYHKKLERPFLIKDFLSLITENIEIDNQPVVIKLIDKITIDETKRIVYLNNKSMKLSKRMMNLFIYLYKNHDNICSREDIFKAVWNDEVEDIFCVDLNIHYLRTRIASTIEYPEIKNIRNKGYMMQ